MTRWMHSADMTVKAVRNGWMPFYPQYNKNNFEIVSDAEKTGAKTDEEIKKYVVEKLKSKELLHAVAEPDEERFPRVWYI
ncbi:MAG: hypothetical protein R2750_05220 [Bacteroidales bacterium]